MWALKAKKLGLRWRQDLLVANKAGDATLPIEDWEMSSNKPQGGGLEMTGAWPILRSEDDGCSVAGCPVDTQSLPSRCDLQSIVRGTDIVIGNEKRTPYHEQIARHITSL